MQNMMPKVRALREKCPDIDIQVDGGINFETAPIAAENGANVLVAGSAVFKSENPSETICKLRSCAK